MKRTVAFLLFLGAMAVLLLQMKGYFERDPREKAFKKKYVDKLEQMEGNQEGTTKVNEVESTKNTETTTDETQEVSLIGTWKITKSFSLNGDSYEGAVKFSQKGEGYSVQWNTNAGSYGGIAIRNNNHLFVGWGSGTYGVVAYKMNGDGTMSGRWMAAKSEGTIGTENLSGGTAGQVAGTYQVTGNNPGKTKPYSGSLIIQQTGSVYQVDWNLAGQNAKGVGIKVGDYLVVGWGMGNRFGVVNYAINGNKMLGRWSIGAADREGVEDLEKIK
ncbi:MAG TPA: hypothetical protein DCS93_23120 [Microscillaceae bacterium]|nr:hypothetical protein [Microscillaceae bacterium]